MGNEFEFYVKGMGDMDLIRFVGGPKHGQEAEGYILDNGDPDLYFPTGNQTYECGKIVESFGHWKWLLSSASIEKQAEERKSVMSFVLRSGYNRQMIEAGYWYRVCVNPPFPNGIENMRGIIYVYEASLKR